MIPPSEDSHKTGSPVKSYDLYTCLTPYKKGWETHQEVAGIEVPNSRGTFKDGRNPFIPLRFIRIDGEDYGRGFIEEYIGDLRSLEALTQSDCRRVVQDQLKFCFLFVLMVQQKAGTCRKHQTVRF